MKRIYLIVIFSIAVTTTSFNTFGQPAHPPLPRMFVEKNIANERIMRFSNIRNSKYERIRELNGYQDLFLIYTRKAVEDLITKINKKPGIRIYFARYNKCDDTQLPEETEENKLILLFSTKTMDGSYPDKFYFLNDKTNDDGSYVVSKKCGIHWIEDYQTSVQKELRKTLSAKDSDNIDPKMPREFSDTKSIFFPDTAITEAFTIEEGYKHVQDGKDLKITAYKVSFSAYGPKGNGRAARPVNKNRLFIQFDYMYDSDLGKEVFYLDDMDNFNARNEATRKKLRSQFKKLSEKAIKERTSIDNGQLCPTNCD